MHRLGRAREDGNTMLARGPTNQHRVWCVPRLFKARLILLLMRPISFQTMIYTECILYKGYQVSTKATDSQPDSSDSKYSVPVS